MKRTMFQFFSLFLPLFMVFSLSGVAQNKSAESAELAETKKLSIEIVRLYNEGKYEEAIPLAKQVVDLKEKILGKEDLSLADSLNNLGALYMVKQDYKNADAAYKRSLAIYEKAKGADDISLTLMLDKLAWIRYGLGLNGGAQELLERSLSIKEKVSGKESTDVGQSLVYLAQFYEKQGKYRQAVPFYQRAVEVLGKINAEETFQAQIIEKCSCTMKLNKQDKEAEELDKRALAIRQKTGEISKDTEGASGKVLAGKAIFRQEPSYPPAAKQARVYGSVVVQVTVDESGNVISAQTLCGHDYFARASEEAARKWRFTPSLLNGVPVKLVGTITFNFMI
jgi:TonB family protein